MVFDKKLWDKTVDFHGHTCPGLAIGYRAAVIALEKLSDNRSDDEELVAIVENDACGVDAIQVITGCSLGKGNLIYKNRGKQAFTIAQRKSGKAVRVYVDTAKLDVEPNDREGKIQAVLTAPAEEFCQVEFVSLKIPEKAKIFPSVVCSCCRERLAEPRAKLQDGKIVCLDCFKPYQRGWESI